MEWYLKVLRHYAVFSGRARRKEYWIFFLFNIFFLIIGIICDNNWGFSKEELPKGFSYIFFTVQFIFPFYALFVIIPSLAVTIRRLHDVGESGWFILISLIPIGVLWLLFLLAKDSQEGTNKWGENPKNTSSND